MSLLGVRGHNGTDDDYFSWLDYAKNQRDRQVQLTISVVFGLSAFLAFCVLRPRWTELYNARKKQSAAASRLPELPKSLFGWIPVVYRISNAEVLASAGLDAYAFLSFFRYAIKYLCVTLFFSLTVILPVNTYYTGDCLFCLQNNSTNSSSIPNQVWLFDEDENKKKDTINISYLWMHVVFTYFFSGIAIYLLVVETKDMIRIRQAYLGTQSTVTDRTIRLSGIPPEMRSEDKLTHFIEDLGIGNVESVMLCRNWRKLDDMVDARMRCLRKLEEAWADYHGHYHSQRHVAPRRRDNGIIGNREETQALLTQDEVEQEHAMYTDNKRPQHTIRYGFMNLRYKQVDAIDYHEERLQRLDNAVQALRQEEFEPTALAFVTMESTAACQMAVQAILDPTPGQLIANLAPPPADVVWWSTYLSRNHRMVRSWAIMVLIGFLTIFWAALLGPLAGLLRIEAIDKVFPGLAQTLEDHPIVASLVQTGLPTLVFSLLSVAIPYLYDWLSNMQGMTSQGDVELSVISKNFFFTFFNLFIIFTVWGTGFTFLKFWEQLRDILKDTTTIALIMVQSLQELSPFYSNLIILQGLGLFPFRLLEIGTVSLYPIYLVGAKTPRDHADLVKAPVFSYGFYLPQTMLIFVICVVYSVWPQSWLIILFGLIYFLIGGFVYKYQLLYAMDHREHSTGRAWPMICNRIIMGLIVFYIAMASTLTLQKAFSQALLIAPLFLSTIWFTFYFQRTYFPLMRFIALKSIDDREHSPVMPTPTISAFDRATDHGRAVEVDSETGQRIRYINPNLIAPLESLWIRKPGQDRRVADL